MTDRHGQGFFVDYINLRKLGAWRLGEKGRYLSMIERFIHDQVVERGLDERTASAYRMDLERFYLWLGSGEDYDARMDGEPRSGCHPMPEEMEVYLDHLSREKGLRYSTVCRKHRVFGSYLAYLASQGILRQYEPLKPVEQREEKRKDVEDTLLTKREVDIFFQTMDRKYDELDSDFRRRVCLRDQVMMKLLFYHEIEISELLRLETTDYDRKEAVLTIRGKRGKVRSVKLFSQVLKKQMEEWLDVHGWFEREGQEMFCNRMFLSKMGRPLSMKMVINIFDKYREMAGIEKGYKPKDLKNSLGKYAREMMMELG